MQNEKAYSAGGAISVGDFVKFSADKTVVRGAANTDDVIGVAKSAVTAAQATAGVKVVVGLPGDLCKVKAAEAITRGKMLVANTDGHAVQTNASADRIGAMALESGVDDDLIDAVVVLGVAVGADD